MAGVWANSIYVEEDVILPPSQQAEVPVRISHYSRMIENGEVPDMTKVYSERSVIPAKFTNVKIPFLNIDKRRQTLKKGAKLGVLHESEIIESNPETKDEDEMSSLQVEDDERPAERIDRRATKQGKTASSRKPSYILDRRTRHWTNASG